MWSKKGRSDPHVPITGLISHTDMVSPPPPLQAQEPGRQQDCGGPVGSGLQQESAVDGDAGAEQPRRVLR